MRARRGLMRVGDGLEAQWEWVEAWEGERSYAGGLEGDFGGLLSRWKLLRRSAATVRTTQDDTELINGKFHGLATKTDPLSFSKCRKSPHYSFNAVPSPSPNSSVSPPYPQQPSTNLSSPSHSINVSTTPKQKLPPGCKSSTKLTPRVLSIV